MPGIFDDIEIQEVGFGLKEKLDNLPRQPGVYQFKNADGKTNGPSNSEKSR